MNAYVPAAVGVVAWPGRTIDRTEFFVGFPDHEFEQFFLDHYDQLVRSLTAVTGDRETARDCVQEGYLKAASRWRKVRRLDDPAGWVRRVAINRSRDLYRSDERRRRRESFVEEVAERPAADPSDHVDGTLRLEELLGHLPRQQRAAAALFYVEDLSVAEIADMLGLSAGAVKFHLNKARGTLRSVLVEDELVHEGQGDGDGAGQHGR
jgi:RNA polymerase sigma-70 factor (ECF subfamily)